MEGTRASDEVIDEIALIAMLRQDSERHGGGGGSASSEALRKLHELRDREQKAMQTAEDKAVHQANLDAVANEIRKVQQYSGGGNRNNGGGGGGGERHARPRPQQQQQPRKEGGGGSPGGGGGGNPHNQSRNKGRRNQGGRQGRP